MCGVCLQGLQGLQGFCGGRGIAYACMHVGVSASPFFLPREGLEGGGGGGGG